MSKLIEMLNRQNERNNMKERVLLILICSALFPLYALMKSAGSFETAYFATESNKIHWITIVPFPFILSIPELIDDKG